jgi:hypothetical protein
VTAKKTEKQLWLGCFTIQQGDDRGSFQAVAQARSVEDAAKILEQRLRSLRTTSTLFSGACQIYLDALFELAAETFATPTVINYTSKREGSKFDIYCPIPEQPDAATEAWGGEVEDGVRKPFVRFPRTRAARARPERRVH